MNKTKTQLYKGLVELLQLGTTPDDGGSYTITGNVEAWILQSLGILGPVPLDRLVEAFITFSTSKTALSVYRTADLESLFALFCELFKLGEASTFVLRHKLSERGMFPAMEVK